MRKFRDKNVTYEQQANRRHWIVSRGTVGFLLVMEDEYPCAADVIKASKRMPSYTLVSDDAHPAQEVTTAGRSSLEQVKEFHTIFGHPVNDKPYLINDKLNALRVNLIQEELDELVEALDARDPVEALDALCDLQYVLDGAWLALGLHTVKDAAVAETHRSNMSKLGADGQPIYREDGKILKGPDFTKPDYRAILLRLLTDV